MNVIDIDSGEYSSVIEIQEIGIVTSALVYGHKIISTNKDPKYAPRVSFLFKKTKAMEELIEKYFKGELPVDAMTFLSTLREVKSRTKTIY